MLILVVWFVGYLALGALAGNFGGVLQFHIAFPAGVFLVTLNPSVVASATPTSWLACGSGTLSLPVAGILSCSQGGLTLRSWCMGCCAGFLCDVLFSKVRVEAGVRCSSDVRFQDNPFGLIEDIFACVLKPALRGPTCNAQVAAGTLVGSVAEEVGSRRSNDVKYGEWTPHLKPGHWDHSDDFEPCRLVVVLAVTLLRKHLLVLALQAGGRVAFVFCRGGALVLATFFVNMLPVLAAARWLIAASVTKYWQVDGVALFPVAYSVIVFLPVLLWGLSFPGPEFPSLCPLDFCRVTVRATYRLTPLLLMLAVCSVGAMQCVASRSYPRSSSM